MAVRVDYLVKESLSNFFRNPTLTLGTILTVSIALSLVGASLLVGRGADKVKEKFEDDIQLIIWLDPNDANLDRNRTIIEDQLESSNQINDFVYVNEDETFESFRRYFETTPSILRIVDDPSILPTSYTVFPVDTDELLIKEIRRKFESLPGVKEISSPDDLIKDTIKTTDITTRTVWVIGGVAFLASILLIYNAIRTAVFARRREIEVMRLVGATKWFVRIPFILEALIQGLLGAFMGCLSTFILNRFTLRSISEIPGAFEGVSLGIGDVWTIYLLLMMIGSLLGAAAAGFAVSKYLNT